MNLYGSRVHRVEIYLALSASPLIVWLALYVTSRLWSVNLRPILPWLRTLRWVAWGLAIVLLLFYLAHDRFPVVYAIAMGSAQLGLALPESWVKHRFAPDLVESPDGYWPRKLE
jgi:hypothetical protein